MNVRLILILLHSGCEQSEALFPSLRDKPPQDDSTDAGVPRRELQPGRQPLRPPPVLIQRQVVVAVQGHRRSGTGHI